jgi:hypothetical protein
VQALLYPSNFGVVGKVGVFSSELCAPPFFSRRTLPAMFFGDSKVTPATAAIDPELAAALALAAAVLSIKMALTHVMVARARMTLGQVVGTNILTPVAVPIFLAFKSIGSPEVALLERIEKNNVENEPYVLLLFFFLGLAGKLPGVDLAVSLIKFFVMMRCAHSFVMLFPNKGPWGNGLQTVFFFPSLILPIWLGGAALM